MTQRERLIELLKQAFYNADDNYGIPNIEQVADNLLENGVIVPPVKIGTRVYTIICGQIYEYEIASYTVDGDGFSFIHLAYMTGNTMHGATHVIEEFKRQYYLTKEEAENAPKSLLKILRIGVIQNDR